MVVAVSCCRTQEARLSKGHLGFMRQGHPLSYYIKHKTHICHLHVYYNASCLPPKILHNLFFKFLLDVAVAPGEIILRTILMRKCYLFIYLFFFFFWGGGQTRSIWEMYKRGIPKYYFTLQTIIKGIYHATAFFRCGFRWRGIAGVYIISQLIKNLAQELMGILNKKIHQALLLQLF